MTPNDVLLQLLDENTYYIHDILEKTSDECLHWRLDEQMNTIAVLIWHVTRAQDVFYTQHVLNKDAEHEIWIANGWYEKASYDPRGIGTHGWGQLTGYTPEEVDAIPKFTSDILNGYYDEVNTVVRMYIETTDIETLEANALGYDAKQSNWFWVRHPIFDMTRHIGEIHLIQGLWERANKP